jgi:hypothetical protein
VTTEGPIHREEFMRRLAGAWGVKRIGKGIHAAMKRAIDTWATEGILKKQGDFLWPPGMQSPAVRRRDDDADRQIDLICPEEIGEAAVLALELQFGMNRNDLVSETARILGFKRTTPYTCHVVNTAIDLATKTGRIEWS